MKKLDGNKISRVCRENLSLTVDVARSQCTPDAIHHVRSVNIDICMPISDSCAAICNTKHFSLEYLTSTAGVFRETMPMEKYGSGLAAARENIQIRENTSGKAEERAAWPPAEFPRWDIVLSSSSSYAVVVVVDESSIQTRNSRASCTGKITKRLPLPNAGETRYHSEIKCSVISGVSTEIFFMSAIHLVADIHV